jgi:tetratricopeptide (TPR) repeat protein
LLREAEHSGLLHLEDDPNGEAAPWIAFEDGMLPEVLAHEVAATAVGPRLHRNAARAKRAFWRDEADQHAQEIAEHLLKSGQPLEALPLLLSAAQACQQAGDLSLANQRYHRLEKLMTAHAPPKLAHELWLGLGEVLLRMGRHGPAEAYLRRLLEEEGVLARLQARGHLRLGELRLIQRQYDDARDHLAHAHRLAAQEGEGEVALEAVLLQGPPEAEEPLTMAELAELQSQVEALTDHAPHLKARGLLHVGRCWLERGDAIAAERYVGRARLIVDEVGDPSLQALTLAELGRALLQQGRLAEGEGLLREARALSREQGDRATLSRTLFGLGLAARQREAPDEARALLEQALQLQHALGLDREAAESLGALGRVHETQGDLSGAHQRYSAALNTPALPPELDAELHLRLGTTALKRGHREPARVALAEAARLFGELGYVPMEVQSLNLLAMEASWRGDHPQALAHLRRSEALAANSADHAGHLFALLALALLAHLGAIEGDPKALLEQAQALQRRAVPAMLPLLATVERALQGLPPQEAISTELPDLQRAWLEKVLAP